MERNFWNSRIEWVNTFYFVFSLLKYQLNFTHFFFDLRAYLLTMHNKLVHKTRSNQLVTDNMKCNYSLLTRKPHLNSTIFPNRVSFQGMQLKFKAWILLSLLVTDRYFILAKLDRSQLGITFRSCKCKKVTYVWMCGSPNKSLLNGRPPVQGLMYAVKP